MQKTQLTEEVFTQMGFKRRWPEYIQNPEYRRGDDHPDGKAYVIDCMGGYKGVMLYGGDVYLKTVEDLHDYLNNPNRHKG